MRLPSLRRRAGTPKQPKPLPFTEAQIRERAYKLWQVDPEGSAEAHWDGAIKELRRERSPVWKLRRSLLPDQWLFGERGISFFLKQVKRLLRLAFTAETPGAALDVLKFVLSAFGVLATVFAGIGLYLTYKTGQEQQQLNTERLVTDRFAKAVEQLGSQGIDVRIGAIYSLERIANDSPKDYSTIMEVLSAFVRNRSPLPQEWKPNSKQKLPKVTTDVQSALTVIGRQLDDNFMYGVDLNSTNLSHANLIVTDFHSVDLHGANLESANLIGSQLPSANLDNADLHGAVLHGANLENADLHSAILNYADLSGVNLKDTKLAKADLKGADLTDVEGMTTDQIKQAQDWEKAHYDPDFRKQLGFPPAKPKP